ncbi:MAG: Phage terminase small subunit [Firmicutes bacterium]|nr:Phage terminase small subunit [Bacillota bacterium]
MGRNRDPNRDKALEIYLEQEGKISNRKIAEMLSLSEKTVSGWKCKDNWLDRRNGVLQKNERSTPKNTEYSKKCGAKPGNQNAKGHGAPKGNKNAVGNKGGYALPGNKNAEKHGFFSRIFPDDEEIRAIVESINIKSPLEMLWENIVIQYTAIARAQRLMYVENQEDTTKMLKRHKDMDNGTEKEWELQFAWDKHAAFLKAQSGAMKTLEGLIARYEDLAGEKKKLEIDKMKAEITKLKGDGNDTPTLNIKIDYGDNNV